MTHVATLWEVTLAADTNFDTPVIDEFTAVFLTEFVPSGLLPLTDYLIRATYYGSDGSVSDPGAATAFTTIAANTQPEPSDPTVWVDCV